MATRRDALFDAVGGDDAFLALARAHHRRCLADPELEHPFTGPDRTRSTSSGSRRTGRRSLGGPARYSAGCADQTHVLWLHSGNGEIDDLGRRFLACFLLASTTPACPTTPS